MPDETTPNVPETEVSTPSEAPAAQSEAESPEEQPAEKPAKAPKAKAAEAEDSEKPARPPKAKAAEAEGEKPAKPPKKEKPPALEDKPFAEFINQDFLPALKQTLAKTGISDLDLSLEERQLPIAALGDAKCWQVIGRWQNDQRQFNIIFSKENIQAPKFFAWADNGSQPTMIESFMIDERKVNLDLLLLYATQRLNGQKWLVMN